MTEAARDTDRRRTFKRLLREARPYWGHVGALAFLSATAAPLALLAPVPVQLAVDSVVEDHPLPGPLAAVVPDAWEGSQMTLLAVVVALQILIALLVQTQVVATWLYSTWVGQRMVLDFRCRLFRRAQRLSLTYHDRRGTSDSVFRIWYDAPCIRDVVVDGLIPLATSVVTLVSMVVVIALLSWQLALVALVIAPVLIFATNHWSRALRGAWHDVKKLESSAQSVVQQALSSLRVVKSFRREDHEEGRFARVSGEGLSTNVRVLRSEGKFSLLMGLTFACGTSAVLYLGIRDVLIGALTVGQFWIVLAYLARLYEPLKAMGKRITTLQRSLASAERAFDLADTPSDVQELPEPIPLTRARGEVRFEGVAFGYENGKNVLSKVDFDIAAGERVGIVGETGSGKTTILSLLLRLYDPTAGRVLLDGIDLRHYSLSDLRSQFAVVLQDPVLFSASLAENIGYARPEATREEIIAASMAAGAHGFIEAMPDGYDTVVGERGMTLSGGERQRVSLARAYLLDAPLLILDEPTSAVDVQTEESIIESMYRLMSGRTTFMIAHRLQTLRNCNRILRVRQGRVQEEQLEDATRPVVLPRSLASRRPTFDLANTLADVPERFHAVRLERARGEVSFENVTFGYEPGRHVLSQVSFDVAPGERLGIVGSAGSGKSTLLSLLLRIHDPTSGRILLDGTDLAQFRLGDLRSQFAVVLQEPVLFPATVRENIGYARPAASHDEVVAAAVAAGAHEFIEALPEGYDTIVGERGTSLSPSQRLRLSLARAYLLDAPLLVLDEPPGSMDSRERDSVLESMARLMTGRTTFMIAHDSKHLRHCTRILRVRQGRVETEQARSLVTASAAGN